ncbi:MAG: hypothetical protein NTW11_03640 [Candidatus Staskawiczbacteria bacterium]|nr:hypothetical protein [Candidatus Staskawiczbacteria bacterium]
MEKSEQKQKRTYHWYLEPLDADTNKAFSMGISSENFWDNLLCKDGTRHNLWRCSSHIRSAFWKSRKSMRLKFRIFVRCGNGGAIRECALYKDK